MVTTIQIFTSDIFGEIRTCQVNNQIMFVGKDVATALGYSKPLNAIAMHVDEDDSLKWGLIDSRGRKQQESREMLKEFLRIPSSFRTQGRS